MNQIDHKFMKFHTDNPHIFNSIVRYSRKVKKAGLKKFGIGAIFERIRWEYIIDKQQEDAGFNINNDFRSRYARLVEQQYPDLKGFFRTRKIDPSSMFAEN